jgi:hypothetical protein
MKLIKQTKDDLKRKKEDTIFGNFNIAAESTSVNIAWNTFLDETEKIAQVHLDFSQNLDLNLRKTIKYRAKDNLQMIKGMQEKLSWLGAKLNR